MSPSNDGLVRFVADAVTESPLDHPVRTTFGGGDWVCTRYHTLSPPLSSARVTAGTQGCRGYRNIGMICATPSHSAVALVVALQTFATYRPLHVELFGPIADAVREARLSIADMPSIALACRFAALIAPARPHHKCPVCNSDSVAHLYSGWRLSDVLTITNNPADDNLRQYHGVI